MKYIFGPVFSRRLGLSLGVDLLPEKVCTFDCVYCECGRTVIKTDEIKEWVPADEVIKEIREYLEGNSSIDFITITGSGEPTLHSKIGYIIEEIKKITSIPVAVLTNGSLLWKKEIRASLKKADVILPSLNAISEKSFRAVNRPYPYLIPHRIIEGLIALRKEYSGKIWLEIVFVKGINDSEEEILKLKEVIEKINPDKIHLNTVVRPPSENWAKPLTFEEMEKIKEILGERAEIVMPRESKEKKIEDDDLEEKILEMAKRRPLTFEELSNTFNLKPEEISNLLNSLLRKGRIKKEIFEGKAFYSSS
jgi:wyosine [tRNA(Phe)-imidazoG37] synthetase (radical SAM superfamily)